MEKELAVKNFQTIQTHKCGNVLFDNILGLEEVSVYSNSPEESFGRKIAFLNVTGKDILLRAGYVTQTNACPDLVLPPDHICMMWRRGNGYFFTEYKIFSFKETEPIKKWSPDRKNKV